ncbi:MAG: aldolase/citrate lyase family protein [Roseiarcus sp.]|jgi:citrate lyase subunit beta / citryl-CoA lyase
MTDAGEDRTPDRNGPAEIRPGRAAAAPTAWAMRSALVVSVDDEAQFARVLACGADAVILDLESPREPARERRGQIAAIFARMADAQNPRPRLIVRVNGLASGATDDDLDAVMPAAPSGILLPGSLGAASVQQLGVKLAVREALLGLADGATRIFALATDSARALSGLDGYRGSGARLEGLVWGADLLAKDIGAQGARRRDGGLRGACALARDLTLLAAAAAGVTPIDAAFADVGDLAGLRAESLAARGDGFRAKLAIDPAQVPIINAVFGAGPPADALG